MKISASTPATLRTSRASVPALCLASSLMALGMGRPASALDFQAMQQNSWYSVTPKWKYLPSVKKGAYQSRNWGTLRYNSQRGSMVFYEGFGPSDRGDFCIYGNSLYEYQPRTDSI